MVQRYKTRNDRAAYEVSQIYRFWVILSDVNGFEIVLSYTRHEYFRRILCNLIGGWVEAGEYPDEKILAENHLWDFLSKCNGLL